ncbi:MAG: G1 family endopeptidase [Candidatus Pacebacteria bacterium]|nr:G1 family endopeptidase [Candidatus Paceibacterota bacterium]
MNLSSVFRFLSLCVLVLSIGALVFGDGALAQNDAHVAQEARSQTEAPQPIPNLPLAPAGSNTDALNWAGYTATGGTYTSVSGSWTVPHIRNGRGSNVADATWIGIGGVTSNDLIQAGTEAIPDSNGTIIYRAWMELLPSDSKIVPLSISPGDSVSVSISEESSGVWDVAFENSTTGKSYETTVHYNSSLSSADWVEEMPVEVGGAVGLDYFGTIHFSGGYAIKDGETVTILASGASPLRMDNSDGDAVAEPSELGADGASFNVSRTDAPSSPLALSSDGTSALPSDRSLYSFATAGADAPGSGYTITMYRDKGGYRIIIRY